MQDEEDAARRLDGRLVDELDASTVASELRAGPSANGSRHRRGSEPDRPRTVDAVDDNEFAVEELWRPRRGGERVEHDDDSRREH